VWVSIVRRPDQLELTVSDNGSGIDADVGPGGGYGLIGMRERIELVGGSLLIESERGSGTTLTVSIPLRPAATGQTP
jgi:signal transduction histidine kinase